MNRIAAIFWNRNEVRLRAGIRAVLQLTLFFGLMKGLSALFGVPSVITSETSLRAIVLVGVVRLLRVVISVYAACRFLDRRRFSGLGLKVSKRWWQDLGFGAGVGIVMMAGIFVVELAFGWVTVTGALCTASPDNSFIPSSLVFVFLFACVGFSEELLARGYLLTNLAEGFNLKDVGPKRAALIGLIVSSLVFGALHLGSPDVSAISIVIIMMIGLLAGLSYLWTGRLAIAIGIHATWNLFQGHVFGLPVSGTTFASDTASFVSVEQDGPELWTGGAFGPEAGLIGICAVLVGTLLVLGWVRLRYGSVQIRDLVRTDGGAGE